MPVIVSSTWAIQKIFTCDIFDLKTGEVKANLQNVKTSGIENQGTTVYADGGDGNPHIIGFDHSRRATATIESGVFSTDILAIQSGNAVVTGANQKAIKRDELTVAALTATTTFLPNGVAGSEIGFVKILNADGSFGKTYTQAAVAAANKFSVALTTIATITFFAGDIIAGSRIVCYYTTTTGVNTKTIKVDTDKFAGNYKVVFTGLARDICNGDDYKCEVIFFKAKVDNNWSMSTTAGGDPAVQSMKIEALKACGSPALYEMIVYSELDV